MPYPLSRFFLIFMTSLLLLWPTMANAQGRGGGSGGSDPLPMPDPVPFTCSSDLHLTRGRNTGVDLHTLTFPNGVTEVGDPVRPNGITDSQAAFDAVGFRVADGFLYGVQGDGRSQRLIQVDATGFVRDMGEIEGLGPGNYDSGAFGADGLLYIRDANSVEIIEIGADNIGRVVDSFGLTQFGGDDWAIDAEGHFAYAVFSNGRINRVSLTADSGEPRGTVTPLPAPSLGGGTYGAQVIDANGRMFVYEDQTQDIFEISLAIDPLTGLPSGAHQQVAVGGQAPNFPLTDGGFCRNAAFPVGGGPTEVSIAGFIDVNGNDARDTGEPDYPLTSAEVVDADGAIIGSAQRSNSGNAATIRNAFRGNGRRARVRGPSGAVIAEVDGVTVDDTTPTSVLVPIDPSGHVYDSDTRDLLEGVGAVLTDAAGTPLPVACLVAGQQPQTTAADGFYRFDVIPGADAACPVAETEYRIAITPPAGYDAPPSSLIPPETGPFNPTGNTTNEIAPNTDRPQGSDPTTYYFDFLLGAGDPDVVNNHIPLDVSGAASSGPQPFVCSRDVYLSQGSGSGVDLFELNFSSATPPVPSLSSAIRPIGITAPQDTYNAIGYRLQDGFIYALNNEEELVQIDATGLVTNLGAVADLPSISGGGGGGGGGFFPAGTVGPDGFYYVGATSQPSIFVIDVTATDINGDPAPEVLRTIATGNFGGADFVIDENSFFAYSVARNGRIQRLSLTSASGVAEGTFNTLPAPSLPNGTYGAQYLDLDNRMFVSRNSDNMIFEISLAVDPALDSDLPSGTNFPLSSAGSEVSRNDGAFCQNEQFPIGAPPTALVIEAFDDGNDNQQRDPGEQVFPDQEFTLDDGNGVVLSTAVSDAEGVARLNNLSAGTGRRVQMRRGANMVTVAENITVGAGLSPTILVPIDPSGRIYASDTREHIEGAFVQLTDDAGAALPEVCLFPTSQQGQLTGADGFYRFDVVPGADAACPTGETEYRIAVTSPSGFLDPPSSSIPPGIGAFNPTGSTTNEIVPNEDRPIGGDPTTHYLDFLLGSGDPDVVNNHIPVDPDIGGVPACSTAGLVEYTFGNPTSTGSGIGQQVLYSNIGSFGGVSIDARLTVLDIEVLDTAGNRVSDALTTNLLLFGQISGRAAIQINGSAGVPTPFTRRRGRIRIEFFQSGTTTPVASDHSLTVGDFDDTRPLGFDIFEQLSIDTSQFADYSFDAGTNLISTQNGTKVTVGGTQNETTGATALNSVRFFFRSSNSVDVDVFVDGIFDSARLFEIDGTANLTFANENCNPLPVARQQDVSDAPVTGTAPDGTSAFNYGNTLHDLSVGLQLGTANDGDDGPRANADASGDLGDDGITSFPTLLVSATDYTIPESNIIATGTGTLHAWIDFDGNGTFAPTEYATAQVTGGSVEAGGLSWTGQSTLNATNTFARFRLTTDVLNDDVSTADFDERSLEFASNGEVEDYAVSILEEVTAVPATPLPTNAFCVTSTSWRQLIYTAGGSANVDGLTANVDTSGTVVNWQASNTADASIFDDTEHTTILPGLPRTNLVYNTAQLPGLDDSFTQNFVGRSVLEVYVHFNSVDQVQYAFDAIDNPGIGWELLSRNDDASNVVAEPDFAFADTLEADQDMNVPDEQAGGDAGRSADGTVRFYSLTGLPIEQLTWRFIEDPESRTLFERFQWGTEVCIPLDFSDAPTTGTSYGSASHGVRADLTLGAEITADGADFDSADASADSDDGVILPELRTGTLASIPVEVSGTSGFLQAWVDWNADGDFDDTGEQIAIDVQDTGGTGTISLPITPPTDAVAGTTFARFRWSTQDGLDPTEDAPDGEVEDYQVTIEAGTIPVTGTVFFDSGAGTGATAHDGLLQGDEDGVGEVTVEAVDVASGDVIAITQTVGDGTYLLNLPPEQDGEQTLIRISAPGGTVLVSNRSAFPPATVDPANGVFVFAAVAGAELAGLDFGLVAEPRLTEDQSRTVVAGSSTLISHRFSAGTDMEVSFALLDESQSVDGAFTATLFSDIDCDRAFGVGDGVITGSQPVVAGEDVCLLVRVASDVGAPDGVRLSYDLEASATYTGLTGSFAAASTPVVLVNSDVVTVGTAGTLELTKEVCNLGAGACDLPTGAGFGLSNSGSPGDVLIYRIEFEITGADAVDGLVIADKTPAYSSLTVTVPSVVTTPDGVVCSLTNPATPAQGYEGVLEWDCAGLVVPGSLGVVSFEVIISE